MRHAASLREAASALKCSGDNIFLDLAVKADLQQVGLAAHLAIFHILLRRAATIIDGDLIPFTAASALKARLDRH